MKLGQFQIYTGNGKGKTTAALGLTLRASGAGMKVFFCQFIKDQAYSEIVALRGLPGITVRQFGTGKGILTYREKEDADIACARAGYEEVRAALTSGEYDLVVCDEINCALMCSLLTEADLLALADLRPQGTELVFTGRGACEAVLARADLITEMRDVRHYYREKRLPARLGIEM